MNLRTNSCHRLIRGFSLCLLLILAGLAPVSAMPPGRRIDATAILEREIPLPVRSRSVPQAAPQMLFSRGTAASQPLPRDIGRVEPFWLRNFVSGRFEQTQASLVAVGRHCFIYLQQGQKVTASALKRIREQFDRVIYPVCTSHFGSEPNPGLDGESKVFLLLADIQDGYATPKDGFVAGYFFKGDLLRQAEYPTHSKVRSNEREIIYIDTNPSDPDAEDYLEIVAHEFQHMIHANQDPEEATWVNEGASQIAPVLCGFAAPNHYQLVLGKSDQSLNYWQTYDPLPCYGRVYLWNQFLIDQLLPTEAARQKFFRTLNRSRKKSIGGYTEALAAFDTTFSDMFTRFCITNAVNDPTLHDHAYAYRSDHLRSFCVAPVRNIHSFPVQHSDSVQVWGSDAYFADVSQLRGRLAVSFSGYRRFMGGTRPTFRVALIQHFSHGGRPARLSFIDLQENPADKNRLIGTGEVVLDGTHDDLTVVVMALAPEEADDTEYTPASGFIYDIALTSNGGEAATQPPHAARFDLDRSAEFCRNTAGSNLDRHRAMHDHFRTLLLRSVTQEAEQGKTHTLDAFLQLAEDCPLDPGLTRDLRARVAFSMSHAHPRPNR